MESNEKQSSISKKEVILISVLSAITVIALCVTVWALVFRQDQGPMIPDYAPPEIEENAETIPDDGSQKMEQPSQGSSVSLTYSKEIAISLGEQKASLLFANPQKSNQDMMLQLVIRDQLIFQSGVLKPGSKLTTMDIDSEAAEKLAAGTYEGKFNVIYYDPDTGERAIVKTEIPVTITVNS